MKIALFVAMLIFSAGACAERVAIEGAGASFEPPKGFTALSAEEIAIKFPNRNAPKTIVGDERRKTTVAFELREMALKDESLPELLNSLADSMHRAVPGLEWKKKELVEIKGQRWIWLEMTSTAIDMDIYNIILMTPRNGKTLVFGFNSTKDLFPTQESVLRDSISSIQLD